MANDTPISSHGNSFSETGVRIVHAVLGSSSRAVCAALVEVEWGAYRVGAFGSCEQCNELCRALEFEIDENTTLVECPECRNLAQPGIESHFAGCSRSTYWASVRGCDVNRGHTVGLTPDPAARICSRCWADGIRDVERCDLS